jgi:hypothetical protein
MNIRKFGGAAYSTAHRIAPDDRTRPSEFGALRRSLLHQLAYRVAKNPAWGYAQAMRKERLRRAALSSSQMLNAPTLRRDAADRRSRDRSR